MVSEVACRFFESQWAGKTDIARANYHACTSVLATAMITVTGRHMSAYVGRIHVIPNQNLQGQT